MNADNVYSRTGYVIRYAGCPIYWQSKLQTEIALFTSETEYIALSQALRETIPMTSLMKEINVIFPIYVPSPRFVVKVREDNQSCIAMAVHQCAQFSANPMRSHKQAVRQRHDVHTRSNKGYRSIC